MRTFPLVLVLMLLPLPALAADPFAQFTSLYGEPISPAEVVSVERERGTEFNSVPLSQTVSRRNEWDGLRGWPSTVRESDVDSSCSRGLRDRVPALHHRLAPYRRLITEASTRFAIPAGVIGAVIMVESSGNRFASAGTSSAKGLMQTIDATFAEARRGLRVEGMRIANDPFDPRASILAGSWYLDRMFRRMESDLGRRFSRRDLVAWRKAAEYYYVGPGLGWRPEPVVRIARGGESVTVDKGAYGRKVLRWVREMG